MTLGILVCASACATPLAPGYTVEKEEREIRFVPVEPARIDVRGQFALRNTGTTELRFIDIDLPAEQTFGRKNLRAQLGGRDAEAANLPEELQHDHPNARRITFSEPWARGQRRELSVEYELSQPADPGYRITVGGNDFHLGSRGWAALPQPPMHFLAPYPKRPDKMMYTVRVPSDFLVLARGKTAGRKREGGEAIYRYQLRTNDLAVFVVGGRYVETALRQNSGTVVFWTLKPLGGDTGAGAERIAQAWATLQNDFGEFDANIHAPHIVESPEVRARAGEDAAAAVAFPGGALVNEQALALGISSDEFVERVTHALARNWFGDEMYPAPDAALAIGEGLPEYATIVVDEARNGAGARQKRIEDYLRRYDAAAKQAVEKPLGVTTMTDPPEQQRIALAKAPLMYAALEDQCGEAPVRAGLRQLVSLLRGEEVGINDLRAAVEPTCGKDLGEFFRTWMYAKGIPQDFRARYGSSSRGD